MVPRRTALLFVSFSPLLASVFGCANKEPEATGTRGDVDAAEAPAPVEQTVDAGREARRGKPVKLGAANFAVSVLDRMEWPESKTGAKRLGYLRHGAVVEAYENREVNDECKEGWYELVGGGFVCAKAAITDLANPRVRLAPKQPDLDKGMPYRYGVNLTDDTPLYRRVLGSDDRKKYEPWLAPPKEDPAVTASAAAAESDKDETAAAVERTAAEVSEPESPSATDAPVDKEKDKGAGKDGKKKGDKSDALDAGVDAGKPKLKQLRGRGVLVRKMARGFYLALDRDFKAANARWWRTTYGFAVPFERIMVQPGVTKHHGTWFWEGVAAGAGGGSVAEEADAGGAARSEEESVEDDGGARAVANVVGFVTTGFARKLELGADGKKMSWGAELPKRSAVMLTGRTITIGGVTYHQSSQGFWVRMTDLALAHPTPPADLGPDERWIDVDITRQALVAFEGTKPVFGTLVSTGRRNLQDKEKDFPTVTGTFRIREKHVTTTMDGDVASDGPYSIEDVPWVMYFEGSYALHGAFWHDQFGRQRSHGCVNMSPDDARTLFGWAEPRLPAGWHGVFADGNGSRVVVHEDAPVKTRR